MDILIPEELKEHLTILLPSHLIVFSLVPSCRMYVKYILTCFASSAFSTTESLMILRCANATSVGFFFFVVDKRF